MRNSDSNLVKIAQNFSENPWKGPKNTTNLLSKRNAEYINAKFSNFAEFNLAKKGQIRTYLFCIN